MDFNKVCSLGVWFQIYAKFLLKGMTRTVADPTICGIQCGDVEVLAIPGLVCCGRATFEQLSVVSMRLPSSPACADALQDTLQFGKRVASANVTAQVGACPGSLCQPNIHCIATALSNSPQGQQFSTSKSDITRLGDCIVHDLQR